MPKKSKWVVRLGQSEWSRYTYQRTAKDGLQLLGSVRRGAQVGALALTDQGTYVQVVGDHTINLNQSQITGALASAQKPVNNWERPTRVQPVAPPVVIVKRRRILEAA